MNNRLTKKTILISLFVSIFSYILLSEIASSSIKGQVTIYLAGDSTVSTYSPSLSPRSGWGQELANMFDEHIKVVNKSARGRSSKSFIDEGRLAQILGSIKKGDYLFIQFGHNDEKRFDPKRYTDPFTSYKSYLSMYIDGARSKGAIPILITPVQRLRFSSDGQAQETHGRYPAAMIELGREKHVAVIDLAAKSRSLYQDLGPVKTRELFLWLKAGESPHYPDGVMDSTHFQEKGAKAIAKLVLEGIKALNLPLKNQILNAYR